ncbi:hypothetical protein MJO29_003074 [Puccinia striiformis f. sp. tritici]|uniref:PQ loop repeat protein n=2 Tax=Puccinia striiformis f. sp. tritici TaxID=168172 RepID=A0A0L0VAJ4_9BASI|nr:hypothetical protein MJO29_003074 [Puccinia striiformis f. sp. tritici]KNE96303.1 hypothetical protein PSTG_10422 [Puccinia striiformis f. sp. tritici PST-78]
MTWISTLSSIGMALGPPLVYLDQYQTIHKTKSSQGFSHLICVVLLIANITRLFYWLGERFETALLIQSILMIIAQLSLLRICLLYTTKSSGPDSAQDSDYRGYSFDTYIDFFALLFAVQSALFILLQRYDWFIQLIGFISLGLESTLPIPQLITNFRRKSLAGLSGMVLFGWIFGDSFKSVYLIFISTESNSIQFKICALFQLSIDILILGQALIYRRQTKLDRQTEEENKNHPEIDDDGADDHDPRSRLMIVDDSAHVV